MFSVIARMCITTIAISFAIILSLQPRDMAAKLEVNTIKFSSYNVHENRV